MLSHPKSSPARPHSLQPPRRSKHLLPGPPLPLRLIELLDGLDVRRAELAVQVRAAVVVVGRVVPSQLGREWGQADLDQMKGCVGAEEEAGCDRDL